MPNNSSHRSLPKFRFSTAVLAMVALLFFGQAFAQSAASPLAATPSLTPDVIAQAETSKTEHHIRQTDNSELFATGFFGGRHVASAATIDIYLPDTWIWNEAQYAKNEYLPFKPSALDESDTLKIIAAGMALAGPTCESPDRVALLSGQSGKVVVEAVSSEDIGYVLQNGFGAKAKCANLLAAFPMSGLERVRAAAENGEFIVGVFYKNGSRKLYKIKHGDQKKLGLPDIQG